MFKFLNLYSRKLTTFLLLLAILVWGGVGCLYLSQKVPKIGWPSFLAEKEITPTPTVAEITPFSSKQPIEQWPVYHGRSGYEIKCPPEFTVKIKNKEALNAISGWIKEAVVFDLPDQIETDSPPILKIEVYNQPLAEVFPDPGDSLVEEVEVSSIRSKKFLWINEEGREVISIFVPLGSDTLYLEGNNSQPVVNQMIGSFLVRES